MPRRQRRKAAKPKLLVDQLGPTLEEKCAGYLAKGLPPDADEFDRVCYEAMARYLAICAKVSQSEPEGGTR